MKAYVLGVLLLMISAYGCRKEFPEKPNILFITADYMAWEDIPEETPVLEMPAIAKLSKEGLVFENHYCNAPVCMPARYSIVSGTYPHTHGRWDNGGGWLPEGSPVMMEELKKSGYQTVAIGKMHFSPRERMAGYDIKISAEGKGNGAADTIRKDDYELYLESAGKTRFDYLKYQDSTDIYGLYDFPLDDTLHVDYYVGEQTVRLIDQDRLKGPWFMWVSFSGPHNPWDPPARYTEKYLQKDLPAARYVPKELQSKPYAHTITRFNYTRKVVDKIDEDFANRDDIIRRIRAGHYGGLTFIDEQIGRIMDELKAKNMLDNTIVVFTADHGAHLGDHGNIHKGTHYERSAHVPFIVWWPGAIKPGKFNSYSEHVNIFPTFVQLAGGTIPEGIEGKSMVPVLEKKEKPSDHAYTEIKGCTSFVNDKYKFGLYRQYQEGDLYDREKDPDELHNLYYDPAYSDVVKELTQQLFDFDPTLEKAFDAAPKVKELPTSITLKGGDVINRGDGPCLTEKSFTLTVDLKVDKDDSGPVFVNDDTQHGFSLYLDKGTVYMAFKTWRKTDIYPVIKAFKPGNLKFTCKLESDGKLIVTDQNGMEISSFMTKWPKPFEEGRQEFFTGTYTAGSAGGARRSMPIGNYRPGNDFTGTINGIKLEIDE